MGDRKSGLAQSLMLAAVAVVLAVVIAWVLFVPAADWLARHDVGNVHGALLQTARNDARGRLLTLGAGLIATGALAFTARSYTLSRRTYELTEQSQVTDRYTKAIAQLGDDKLDIRIGGIYALERVARNSVRDFTTVMEVLAAFIREHSREPWPERPRRKLRPSPSRTSGPRPDVHAALIVIARRDIKNDRWGIDLTGANLAGAKLSRMPLKWAKLDRAILTGANLGQTDLTQASLKKADLREASLFMAHLMQAHLDDADLTGASLHDAELQRARLSGANFSKADLFGADLSGTYPFGIPFDPREANFSGASLTFAIWPTGQRIPSGWQRDPDGRLERTPDNPL